MKREIKFRAYDKRDKVWLFGYDMPNLGGFSLIGEVILLGEFASLNLDKLLNDVEIMQYTGLKDKDGKEIYEGDIIKCPNGYYWEVVYDLTGASFCEKNPKCKQLGPIDNANGIIIGNVFENPELLNN